MDKKNKVGIFTMRIDKEMENKLMELCGDYNLSKTALVGFLIKTKHREVEEFKEMVRKNKKD